MGGFFTLSTPELRRRCQAIAMLDAIASPEWEGRRYSWNPSWDDGEQVLEGRDGQGDSLLILFRDESLAINAEDYFDDSLNYTRAASAVVSLIYDFTPLTRDMVLALSPDFDDWDQLAADLEEIGYPAGGTGEVRNTANSQQ